MPSGGSLMNHDGNCLIRVVPLNYPLQLLELTYYNHQLTAAVVRY
jgi:hypothetical protein